MFSPETAYGTLPARNPRRRQRVSEESTTTKQSTKRRKRSSISGDTFRRPSEQSNGSIKLHQGATASEHWNDHQELESTGDVTHLALRHKNSKRAPKERRGRASVEGVVQTKNDSFMVIQDANIPPSLHSCLSSEPWHGGFFPSLGRAIVLTHSRAIIWHYHAKPLSSEPSPPIELPLPLGTSNAAETRRPLPLGVLVHDSSVGEVALLVVAPATGRLVYCESIQTAANSYLSRKDTSSLVGSVGGLLFGETIVNITEIEHDGFILSSSTGRAYHLSVRDSRGRLQAHTELLHSEGSGGVGFFGGLRSVFGGMSWKRNLAAVRARPGPSKTRRQCIIGTQPGVFQVWDLVRDSTTSLSFDLDAHQPLFDAVRKASSSDISSDHAHDFSVLDFILHQEQDARRMLLLTGTARRDAQTAYHLVDVSLDKHQLDIHAVFPVTRYHGRSRGADLAAAPAITPRILHTHHGQAFVVTDEAVVLVLLAPVEHSDAPLTESNLADSTAGSYQEVVYLKQQPGVADYRVVGCAADGGGEATDAASISILVHGFGLARITVFPDHSASASERAERSMRSKMEQNIFFGMMPTNLLDFSLDRQDISYDDDEVDVAAVEISVSILDGTSPYLPEVTPSMDHLLDLRAKALADLIKFASPYPMRPEARWYLLWHAEKLAAARAVWQWQNAFMAIKPSGAVPLLPELLDMMSETLKKENRPDLGETDIIRHYLIHDIYRLDSLLPWTHQAIRELMVEGLDPTNEQHQTKYLFFVDQANSVLLAATRTAFEFRQAHASSYGIPSQHLTDGIFQGDYRGLPEFWTSHELTVKKIRSQADLSREATLMMTLADDAADVKALLMPKLANDSVALVDLCCHMYEESSRWMSQHEEERFRLYGHALQHDYPLLRRELILKLESIDRVDEAVALAEKYEDLPLAVEIVTTSTINESTKISKGIEHAWVASQYTKCFARMGRNRDMEQSLFRKYGQQWARIFFSKQIDMGRSGALFKDADEYREYLAPFLRDHPELARLRWLHDATALKDYARASQDLTLAQTETVNLWNKKVQLSLGKLSILAAEEQGQLSSPDACPTMVRGSEIGLTLIAIQERLYDYIHLAGVGGIDEDATVQLIMITFGHTVRELPALSALLEENIRQLVRKHALEAEELADTLSLISQDPQAPEHDLMATRFFLALKVLYLSATHASHPTRHRLQEQLIWRRVMVQDDWTAINRTETKSDKAVRRETERTALFHTLKAGFQDGLFQMHPIPDVSTLINVGTDESALLAGPRYGHESPEAARAFAHDFTTEDQRLQKQVADGRLDLWCQGIFDDAQENLRRERDMQGVEMGKKEKDRQEVSRRLELDGDLSWLHGRLKQTGAMVAIEEIESEGGDGDGGDDEGIHLVDLANDGDHFDVDT